MHLRSREPSADMFANKSKWLLGMFSCSQAEACKRLVCDKVHACNEGLSCSSKQTDIVPKFSMFCAFNTPFYVIILVCL
jgi:hypothetical protein